MKLEGLLAAELGAGYLALNASDAPDWQQQSELMSPAGVTLGEARLCIRRTTSCFFWHSDGCNEHRLRAVAQWFLVHEELLAQAAVSTLCTNPAVH